MNIKQTIITATVALTMVAMIAPMTAGAVTVADLQAQINALMAQLTTLQGPTTTTTSTPAACVGVTFSRNLRVGSKGSDVKCFQVLLNSHGFQLSASGAGSPGNETSFFGPKTLVAVKKWQVAQGWTPANQVGPLSRAKFNSWLSNSPVTPPVTPPVTSVPTGAGLSVMLASDTPGSAAVVSNAALVPLVKLTFKNGDNASVKVTNVKLNRIGVSADASLNNVYLFDGANRLTDAASVSSGVITFNDSTGLFTVDSMGSRNLTVYADLAASSGETLGVSLMAGSNITSNASSVTGTYPVNGNLMSVATATLAGVNLTGATPTPSAANINPANDTVVWENLTSVTTRSVTFGWLRLRSIGTINMTKDLTNLRLYVDGVMLGSAVPNLDANGYVTFDLTSAPVTLQTGTRDIKVLADVVGGSSKKFNFSIRAVADVRFTDTQYLANVLVKQNSIAFAVATTGDQTINSGTITVQKAVDSPSGNITNLASSQVLGRFILTAAGEKVKVDTLTASVITKDKDGAAKASISCLRNGALFANGVQIGSTSDLYSTTNAACTSSTTLLLKAFTLGSSLIVDPASPVTIEVRGDIFDNDATNSIISGDTLQAQLNVGSANGTGVVSSVTSAVPTSTLTANQLTVKTGTLTLAKYTAYTNSNAVAPNTALKLAHFTLVNDTVEPINLTAIETDLNSVSTYTTNLYVKYGTQQTPKIATPAATNSQSIFYTLAPSTTIDVMVFTDIAAASTSGTGVASVEVCGTTVNSATAVYTNSGTTCANGTLAGQTVTFTTGSVTSAVDASTPLNQIVAGNQSAFTAAKFKVTAQNDSFTIKELRVTVASAAISAAVNNVSLWDGTTLLSTQPINQVTNTSAFFTGLAVAVPANTTKVLTVSLSLATPYTDYIGTPGTIITTGRNAKITMSYLKVANSQGVETTPTTSNAGNDVLVRKSIPTVTLLSLPANQGAQLTSGSTTSLYHLQVAADAKGPIALKQFSFTVTPVDNGAASSPLPSISAFKFFRGSTDITTSVTIQTAAGASLKGTTSIQTNAVSKVVNVTFNTEEAIPAGGLYDYTLKGTPAGFQISTTGNDSVSTALPSDATAFVGISSSDSAYLASAGPSDTAVALLALTSNQTTAASGGTVNFIWSDYSAQVHNYAQGTSNSADWFSGYEVLTLPLDAVGITAQ